MNIRRILAVFDAVWLPLLLAASTLWLYAPVLHHAHIGHHLAVISVYEATGKPLSWLFRAGDIVGAVIVCLAVWRARLFGKVPWLGGALLLVAFLAVVDDIFVIGCYQQCSLWASISHRIHDYESIVSLLALAFATAVDAWHNKSLFSRLFLIAQLLAAGLLVSPLIDVQVRVFLQYVYQITVVIWLAWVLRRYTPGPPRSFVLPMVRPVFAGLVFLGGLFELLLALHVHLYGVWTDILFRHGEPVWLAEHGVAVSVIMLYLSRFIYRGERRAAIILIAVLGSLVFKYALVQPNPVLLAACEFFLLGLWAGWPVFNRNTTVPPLASKLKSLLIVIVGVLIALILFVLLTATSARGREFLQDSRQQFLHSVERLEPSPRTRRLQHRLTHLRYVSAGLGVSILLLTIWSIFRPARKVVTHESLTTNEVRALLQHFATSSEDYFKLWPSDKTYFTVPGIEGTIVYKKVSGTAFALADPIGHFPEQLMVAFRQHCRQYGWSVCFLMVSESSLGLYESNGLNILRIGSSAIINIQTFSTVTVHDKWWRWQLNRAKRERLQYEAALPPHSPELLREMKALSDAWLARAGHSEQGFALGYFDEAYLQECTMHLLRRESGELVAFANQLPVFNGLAQATVDLIRFLPDVNGAMPVLMAEIITGLQKDGLYRAFDLGFVPLAKVDNVVANIARRLAASRFSAAGLEQFKDKFRPDWQPQFLAYEGDFVDLAVLLSRLQKALQVTNPAESESGNSDET